MKLKCLGEPIILEKKHEQIIKEDLEGLALAHAFFMVKRGYLSSEEFELTVGSSPPSFINIFFMLWNFLEKSLSYEETRRIMNDFYSLSPFIYSKDNAFVWPSLFLGLVTEKIFEIPKEKVNLDNIKKKTSELMEETGWKCSNPRHVWTYFSLNWASIIGWLSEDFDKIAFRNFLELAFWIPINACFTMDTKSFIAERMSITEMLTKSVFEPAAIITTPLGQLSYDFTIKLKSIAQKLRQNEFSDEIFINKELPKIISRYIQQICDDFRSKKPKLYPKKEWEFMANTPTHIIREPLKEFLERYDQKLYEKKLKEIIISSLYYPEDCIDIMEKRAEKNYTQLQV